MDTKPNPSKGTPPMSMAEKIAARSKEDNALLGIHQDQALIHAAYPAISTKLFTDEQSSHSGLSQIRNDSKYSIARTLNDIVLGVAILGLVFGVGLGIYYEMIFVAVSAIISCMAIIILTTVAKAVFDIADQVLSNK